MKKVFLISFVVVLLAACSAETSDNKVKNQTNEYNSSQNTEVTAPTESDHKSPTVKGALTEKEINMQKSIIETNLGNIIIEFYPKDAPQTVENFKKLTADGYYNGVIFHRVIKGFMIQGGDPTGTGMGGPGYKFADEINKDSDLYKTGYKKGVVAMANAGPNTNGSQFFIMHQDYPLPPAYTIFGHVVEGQEIVDKIAEVETDANDKPKNPVKMLKVTLAE